MTRAPITGICIALVLGACSSAAGQSLKFEVASIKPSPPRAPGTGQGRVQCYLPSPVRYSCLNSTVSLMVLTAYSVKPYLLDPPAAQDTVRYNLDATVPAGTTAEQANVMLQNLLTERFKLAFHRAKKELDGYALTIAKGGAKIKESGPESNLPLDPKAAPIVSPEGFRNFRSPDGFSVSYANGLTRWMGFGIAKGEQGRANLCGILNSITGVPVVDESGLNGKYDVTLTFSTANAKGEKVDTDDTAPTVFAALEQQLGLRLVKRKIPAEVFVIDRVEKPVEN